jgi:elongation factor G
MKAYDAPDIRNVALVGHGDCGKTSLTSAMLFVTGAVNRLGKVDDGTSTTDFDDEEIERKISLQTSLAHAEWRNTKINLIDTPGYAAFVADAKAGLAVADAAFLVVEAVAGVQVITERLFKYCQEFQGPRIFVINKLDRDNASFERALNSVSERFDRRAAPIQIPIGSESGFEGVVDLITMKSHRYAKDASGQVGDVPADLWTKVPRQARRDGRRERRRADGSVFRVGRPARPGARAPQSLLERKVFPVMLASATKAIGIRNLLDAAVDLAPAAERADRVGTNPATGPRCASGRWPVRLRLQDHRRPRRPHVPVPRLLGRVARRHAGPEREPRRRGAAG